MSYFHTGIRTIIGAEAFHRPVRDGKGWDHLAMVIRLNRTLSILGQKEKPICRVDHRNSFGDDQMMFAIVGMS